MVFHMKSESRGSLSWERKTCDYCLFHCPTVVTCHTFIRHTFVACHKVIRVVNSGIEKICFYFYCARQDAARMDENEECKPMSNFSCWDLSPCMCSVFASPLPHWFPFLALSSLCECADHATILSVGQFNTTTNNGTPTILSMGQISTRTKNVTIQHT